MDDRKATVLRALVDEHIRTGQPVPSRAILENTDLQVSSATVRNDLAALESEGYLVQPHTSAGRIPSDKGFRFYVDFSDPANLRAKTRDRIDQFFASFHSELRTLLRQTSELLTDLTAYPAVVIGPGLESEKIHGVQLVQIESRVLMMVLVTEAGRVTQELVRLPEPLDHAQVVELEGVLSRTLVGGTLDDARVPLAEVPTKLPVSDAKLFVALSEAAMRSQDESRELYVGGTSHLAELWEDITKVHFVLELLERESELLELVGSQGQGTLVQIGPDLGRIELDLAVVSTSFGVDERQAGRVAVLGPMRMDYRRTIRVVEEVGDGLTENLNS